MRQAHAVSLLALIVATGCSSAQGAAPTGGRERAPDANVHVATSASASASASSVSVPLDVAPMIGAVEIPPPSGEEFSLPTLPDEPGFSPPPDRWWEQPDPCLAGARVTRSKKQGSAPGVAFTDFVEEIACRRGAKAHGWLTLLRADGTPAVESHYVDDVPHGLSRSFYPGGSLASTEYRLRGKLTGARRRVHRSGNIWEEGPYADGKAHGLFVEGADWGFVARGYYVRGVATGRWIAELEGRVVFVGEYRDGELARESKQWWKSGELMLTRTLDRGGGSVRVLDRSGAVIAAFECANWTVARAKWIDASGAVSGTFEPGADRRPAWAAPPPMRGDGLDYVCRGSPILLYENAVLAP